MDIRKPYTEIGDSDAYSGRQYDEKYVASFITKYEMPCNRTTGFLTPAFRTITAALTPEVEIAGRPKQLYRYVLQLLTDVYTNRVSPEDLLAETIRHLIIIRDERKQRMTSLLSELKASKGNFPWSAEAIVKLIEQHLASPRSSRLPVLVVAAAYKTAENYLGERVLPLESHNAADSQTHALGDVQIMLANDEAIITCYEMKMKRVTINDIDQALQKIANSHKRIDNYIFITTDVITQEVHDYALTIYERTGGIELVVLDCIGFLRHFLHLFHRSRMAFLDFYQEFLLAEPESAVSQPLKEAFLALRQVAESGE